MAEEAGNPVRKWDGIVVAILFDQCLFHKMLVFGD
jgi:hypothetical protein